ncbi:hypothetical protein AWB83_04720 [Caballeronia ptereochthonis]|uniref:Uncharacterized protein n=1 Tax=Caballeronia ptereochthonis TaxID=1777144 RepID=A0A158CVH0_9BURK|nr:hypothetical protein AWB83_04720 [Caballeronia ptereochthonis]
MHKCCETFHDPDDYPPVPPKDPSPDGVEPDNPWPRKPSAFTVPTMVVAACRIAVHSKVVQYHSQESQSLIDRYR